MNFFKKKPQKKPKQQVQVNKTAASDPKGKPKQWTSAFQGGGKRQQAKPLDDSIAIPDRPRFLPPGTSYNISTSKPKTDQTPLGIPSVEVPVMK